MVANGESVVANHIGEVRAISDTGIELHIKYVLYNLTSEII